MSARGLRPTLASIGLLWAATGTCSPAQAEADRVTPFAENVVIHVVLHELGHALVREFDLPVLANEETLADAFATHYLTHHMPDRAFEVLEARVASLMIEASEVPRDEWDVLGEHNNDARRAAQIVALALAADFERFAPLADSLGMSEGRIASARDYGAEIHRSWRRTLAPLRMPDGLESEEVRLTFDPSSALIESLGEGATIVALEEALRLFDWHSQVTLAFVQGDGGASWSRSSRTITVHTEYIRRFMRQGEGRS